MRAPNERSSDLLAGTGKEKRATAPGEGELWASVFKRLVLWTVKRHRANPADAEEVVQEAVRQFIQSGGVADPADPKAFLDALGSRINGIVINRRRKKATRAVRLTADGSQAELDDPPDPSERIIEGQLANKAISALLERLGDDALATAVVMQTADGVEDPADQAKALGRDVHEVYNARRRIKVKTDAVRKLMEDL
jgi:RNA polymerase sigma factor (sigma-70 family)